MKALTGAFALLLLASAGPAGAKSFAWCQVNGGKYSAYLSAIVEIEDGPDAFRALKSSFGSDFRAYVQASLDPNATAPSCLEQESRFFAEDYIDVLINANPAFNFVRTEWRGGGGRAPGASSPRRGGGGSRNTSSRSAGERSSGKM